MSNEKKEKKPFHVNEVLDIKVKRKKFKNILIKMTFVIFTLQEFFLFIH